jgi:hypothetical protein
VLASGGNLEIIVREIVAFYHELGIQQGICFDYTLIDEDE